MTAAAVAGAAPGERTYQAALAGALFLLGLFLPWSTAGTSLALGLLLLVYLAAPRRAWAATPWRDPLVAVGLVLLAWIGLRSLAASGWQEQTLKAANQYHELLLVPLVCALVVLAQRRNAFLFGLMAGALGLALAHWLPLPAAVANKVELRRISAGFGLSLCAFLFYEEARLRRLPRAVGYGAAAFLAATVLFGVHARTGHVVLLLLAACAAWRTAPLRWRWPVLVSILAAALLIYAVLANVREQRGDIAISNRIRTELVQNTVDIVRDHWLVGIGWAGFGKAYADAAAETGAPPDALWAHSSNPHNEFLMQAAGGGLPALGLFAAWLGIPLVAAWRRRATDAQAGVLACVALAFAVGCALNSLLLDFVEGHLYASLVAWLMAQRE